METINRCEKHDTTFIAEAETIFDRCFECVFEENDTLTKTLEKRDVLIGNLHHALMNPDTSDDEKWESMKAILEGGE